MKINLICRDCMSPLHMDLANAGEELECDVCGHKIPAGDAKDHILIEKSVKKQRTVNLVGFLFLLVTLASYLTYCLVLNYDPEAVEQAQLFLVVTGVGALATLVTAIMAETKRLVPYF